LSVGEATKVVVSLTESDDTPKADVVYLDPMFPPRTKSAAVKKGMQILHGLLDTQQSDDESTNQRNLEESQLLELALQAAKVRVVVKRPIRATPLGGDSSVTPRPSYDVEGSVNRWDVYVKNH
jgi:16S rRNA (guanine1516-N2)-methyltransferase